MNDFTVRTSGPSLDQAIRLHQQGQLAEAERAYLEILAAQPSDPGALQLLGVIRQQQGRHAEALELIGRAVAQVPDKAVYRNNYGAVFFALGRHGAALAEFQRAVTFCPEYADAWANLGMALEAGEGEETDTPSPPAPLPRTGEGRNALSSPSPQASEAAFRRALEIQPWHRDATIQLAAMLGNHGRDAEARQLLAAALVAARCAEFHAALGNLLLNAGLPGHAAKQYRAAIKLKPDDAIVHLSLGNACQELHATEEARKCLARAAALRPDKPLWRLRAEICGPVVFENVEEIEAYCARVESLLECGNLLPLSKAVKDRQRERRGGGESRDDHAGAVPAPHSVEKTENQKAAMNCRTPKGSTNLNDLLEAGAFPPFALAYHGRNQRTLKERFAAIYEPCFRDQPPPTGSGLRDRKRIGILVTRRHEGMFVKSMRGIVERLNTERFEIVILCSRAVVASLNSKLQCGNLRFVAFGESLPDAIGQIRAAACDLIYYWEVGSDATNYFLPFARLAPVQCTGWGSAITSGLPAVDWFLSSELLERPGSESQYSERLWKSRTLFRYQERLPATAAAIPADFGLPEGRHLYLCLQNPLKLHPDFDHLLAGILEADPRGLIVLLADGSGQVARLLKERFKRRILSQLSNEAGDTSPHPLPLSRGGRGEIMHPHPLPLSRDHEYVVPGARGVAERTVFLPPRPFDDYCRLLQLADVILDTRHFGAGITCYDMFSYNLPVVTWPGELILGRFTEACYRKMGVEDLIVHSAEEYVSKAVQVATDGDYRKYVTGRIAQASDVLFNDLEAVREHERFFEDAVNTGK